MPVAAAGLFVYGVGTGIWDVAMNVEGAEVERGLGRSVMPRFHAGFSLGTILGAGIGVAVTALGAADARSTSACSVASARSSRSAGPAAFLPAVEEHPAADVRRGSAWLEPRTLAVGLMVLCFAVAEGSANDWLSLALIDGYDVDALGRRHRLRGLRDRDDPGPAGRDRSCSTGSAGRPSCGARRPPPRPGIVLVVVGDHVVLVGLGILVWGLGASLGFPVGMSAAADDPARAAARVSVVSTIGYGAFLAGPPLLGALGDRVGTLESLLAVAVLMGPAMLAVFAARARARGVANVTVPKRVGDGVTRGPDGARWSPCSSFSVIVLLALAVAGLTLVKAGRDIDAADDADPVRSARRRV